VQARSDRCLLALLVACALFGAACGYRKDVVVSREKMQGLLDKKFPVEKDIVVAKLKLETPKVYFRGDNIGMSLRYAGSFWGKSATGQVTFDGQLDYKPEKGAFYLSNIAIGELGVNENDFADKEKLKGKMLAVLNAVLPHIPVYSLDQKDFKHQLAKLLLKRLHVEGENLILTMGIG
jgi:hypothetical protein